MEREGIGGKKGGRERLDVYYFAGARGRKRTRRGLLEKKKAGRRKRKKERSSADFPLALHHHL